MKNTSEYERRGVMIDCSRNAVMKPERIKEYIDIIASLGYNNLMLYTEDTYELKNNPYFGYKRGRFTAEELKGIDAYAKEKGIELIPCIQTLAHLGTIFRWPVYNDVNDFGAALLTGDEKTYAFIEDMFATAAECFSSRLIHIGMDEAYAMGRGKLLDRDGCVDKMKVMIAHLSRVCKIAEKYGFEVIMWADMLVHLLGGFDGNVTKVKEFSIPDYVKEQFPKNVNLVYWDYYSVEEKNYLDHLAAYKRFDDNIWFAGGLWTWGGFTPHNKYSMAAMDAALSACEKHNVKNVFVTMWGDDGAECSRFSTLPSLYYTAQRLKGIKDTDEIKAGFEAQFGIPFDDYMLLDLLGTVNDSDKEFFNAEKYLLYNDCFSGVFDNSIAENTAREFMQVSEKLEKFAHNEKYGLVFDYEAKLCRALALKCDLGLRTKRAYLDGNKEELLRLVPIYNNFVTALDEFYESFERRWMWENKPQGFEIQDIRIGGLKQRTLHCKNVIMRYLDGKITSIPELEEPTLDVLCRKEDAGHHTFYDCWQRTVSVNVF